MAASIWYTIAKGMIERGVMTEVALDTLLRIKKITAAEHAELLDLWISKIDPEPTPEEPTDGEVDAPSGPVNGGADGGTD